MSRIDRAPHDRDYTVIANAALRDSRLSWDARGVLAYLLSKPDNWTAMQAELEAASPDGRTVVRSALAELESFGYFTRTMRNTTAGRVVDTIVSERPRAALALEPSGGFPLRGIAAQEVPIEESSQRRKSAVGSVVQPPLVAVVHEEPVAPPPAWARAPMGRKVEAAREAVAADG